MQKKLAIIAIISSLCVIAAASVHANADDDYVSDFKHKTGSSCDKTFHELEDACPNMICRDSLVNAWAECWRKSMNAELDKRLLRLKSTDPAEFNLEMALQKNFNQETQRLCGKSCKSGGGTMRGIPYNFCRVDAYKYRTAQAVMIDRNEFAIPMQGVEITKSKKHKTKETKDYRQFAEQLCKIPESAWKHGKRPHDCQEKVIQELNEFQFTDNVCDLS